MSTVLQGASESLHRARLFPLPILATVARPPCRTSARIRHRLKLQRLIVAVTNRCICTLNRLYSAPPTRQPTLSISIHSSQPDIDSFCHCCRPSDRSSSAQQRVLAHLRERCAAFVFDARTWTPSHHGPTCDIHTSVLDALVEQSSPSPPKAAGGQPLPSPATTAASPGQDSLLLQGPSAADYSPPTISAFSSAPTAVVPLLADRISLPQQLHIVPLLGVLPPDVAARYAEPSSSALLRSDIEVFVLNHLKPLKPPRVAGSRAEYVRLIGRMFRLGMTSFTASPRAVNGVFAVAKDTDTDRIIIDAQPCNRLFVDSPHVSLPGPSHLVQLILPGDATMFVAKSDLSNFYHHIGIPGWMQPYLALPPLAASELASIGAPTGAAFPMCVSLAMGFSHAVFLAQTAHEHILYSGGVLQRADSLLRLPSPIVSAERALHGVVIDDFFLFSLNRELATQQMQRVLGAYRAAGFVVKESKLVMPTSDPVKVIGFDIDGRSGTIRLPSDSQHSLVRATISALRADTMTGLQLAHIVGRWTWVMMLRRPTLAVLQQVYRFSRLAQGRRFTVWSSVRRELRMLLSLLPLLTAGLRAPLFHRAVASDASELAGGVVSVPLTTELTSMLWPLCSSRHHATQQAVLNAQRASHLRAAPEAPVPHALLSALAPFDSFYETVEKTEWRTVISKRWDSAEHINSLELRAALLAVHWALSYPSALSSRVLLLLDSSAAFFSLWKGRSSSPALLLVLRKISALLLAGGLSLLPGWVPSAVNPADAPSRLLQDDCPASGRAAA